jgi:hypothetical protein
MSPLDDILLQHGAPQGLLQSSLKEAIKKLILEEIIGGDVLTDDTMSNRTYNNIIGGNIARKFQRNRLKEL